MADNDGHLVQETGDRAAALLYKAWSGAGPDTLDDIPSDLMSTISGGADGEPELERTLELVQRNQLPSTAAHHLGQQQHQWAPPLPLLGAAPLAGPTAMPPPPPQRTEQATQLPLQVDLQQLQLLMQPQLLLAQQQAPPPPMQQQQQQRQQQQVAQPFLQQQWQQAEPPPLQLLQQQRQAVVPPPAGCPSEEWLLETARLLSSPEGGSKDIGLRRLGEMMLGLTMHVDANGYELPTAFPKEVLRLPGPTASLLITRGKAVGSKKTSGSWKSGPQPFKVAEGVYLAHVYYHRCSCGKTRDKACAEQEHPYNNVCPYALAFFEPRVRVCSWDPEAEQRGVPVPSDLKHHPLAQPSEHKPSSPGGEPQPDPRPNPKRKVYIDMWVSSKVMAYLSVVPEAQQQQQQQQQQLTEGQLRDQQQQQQEQAGMAQPSALQLPVTQAPLPLLPSQEFPPPQHQALLQPPPQLELMLASPLPPQQQQQRQQEQQEQAHEQLQQQYGPQPIEAGASSAAATSPLPAWAADRDLIWSFLLEHAGRPIHGGAGLAGSPAAAGATNADAAGQATGLQGVELLSRWRALLSKVPPEHLLAMRADGALGEELQGQCLAHWLATPPDRLEEPFLKPIPRDPDVPLPERLAVQMVQAVIDRMGLELWRSLLCVGDTKHNATALHRVCCFGHRLQLVALMLKHAPRCALLCDTGHFWLPYHSAFRRGHYEAGLMHLREVVKLCSELASSGAAAGPGSGSAAAAPPAVAAAYKSYRDDPRRLLVFNLKNQHFDREDEGRASGHVLMIQACSELGLGEPRVLGKPKVLGTTADEHDEWPEKKEDAKALTKLVVRCGVLDTAEDLQGLGLRQGQGGVGEKDERAPGSKRPRGG